LAQCECQFFRDKATATDFSVRHGGPGDPFVLVSGGRSAFRTVDLLELAAILANLGEARNED